MAEQRLTCHSQYWFGFGNVVGRNPGFGVTGKDVIEIACSGNHCRTNVFTTPSTAALTKAPTAPTYAPTDSPTKAPTPPTYAPTESPTLHHNFADSHQLVLCQLRRVLCPGKGNAPVSSSYHVASRRAVQSGGWSQQGAVEGFGGGCIIFTRIFKPTKTIPNLV